MINLEDNNTRKELTRLLVRCREISVKKMTDYLEKEQEFLFHEEERSLLMINKALKKIEKEHLLNTNTLNL